MPLPFASTRRTSACATPAIVPPKVHFGASPRPSWHDRQSLPALWPFRRADPGVDGGWPPNPSGGGGGGGPASTLQPTWSLPLIIAWNAAMAAALPPTVPPGGMMDPDAPWILASDSCASFLLGSSFAVADRSVRLVRPLSDPLIGGSEWQPTHCVLRIA